MARRLAARPPALEPLGARDDLATNVEHEHEVAQADRGRRICSEAIGGDALASEHTVQIRAGDDDAVQPTVLDELATPLYELVGAWG